MNKIFAIGLTAIAAISFSATTASAKKLRKHPHHAYQQGADGYGYGYGGYGYVRRDMSDRRYGAYGMMGMSSPFYGNAAMSGNNGNSAQGSNSLGHIEGGNIGAGK